MKIVNTYLSITCALISLFTVFDLSAKQVIVEIYDKQFVPATIIIEQGDTVIWLNKEKRQYHNVWFKQLSPTEPQYFFPDESYQLTFNHKGEFNYLCGPHPKMTGLVKVK